MFNLNLALNQSVRALLNSNWYLKVTQEFFRQLFGTTHVSSVQKEHSWSFESLLEDQYHLKDVIQGFDCQFSLIFHDFSSIQSLKEKYP